MENHEIYLNPREMQVKKCNSFKQLYAVISTFQYIEGGLREYSGQEVISIIDRVRKNQITLKHITRTHGLRAKVQELLDTKEPDHFEMAVELEIPRYGRESDTAASLEEAEPPEPTRNPKEPDELETAVELDLPRADVAEPLPEVVQDNIDDGPETGPTKSSLAPLTAEEEKFLLDRADMSDIGEYGSKEEWATRYGEKPFSEMWKEGLERQAQLKEKKRQFDLFRHPSTFDGLISKMEMADVLFDDRGERLELSTQEYIKKTESARLGIDVELPPFLRTIVEGLIAREISEVLKKRRGVAHIASHEWDAYTKNNSPRYDQRRHLERLLNNSSENVFTKKGKVNGKLVWVDYRIGAAGSDVAVFKTEHNDEYLLLSAEDLRLENSNQTIAEHYGRDTGRPREQQMPYPR